MKYKTHHLLLVSLVSLLAWTAAPGCKKENTPSAEQIAADKEAAEKAAVAKALADKDASDKAAADKAAKDKLAADKAAQDKAAVDKANADKIAAQKAAEEKDKENAKLRAEMDKIAADKAAAEAAAKKEKNEEAALPQDLVAAKSEIARAISQIDITMAKLDLLVDATDYKKPSQDALDAIKTLETEVEGVKKRSSDMRDRGAAYFEEWEKQLKAMSTPEIVALATKRKDDIAAKYAEVLTSMQESRAAFDPFWTDLKNIEKAIDDGVTAESMKTLAPQIKTVKEKAATLKTRVSATSTKLNQLGGIYTKP